MNDIKKNIDLSLILNNLILSKVKIVNILKESIKSNLVDDVRLGNELNSIVDLILNFLKTKEIDNYLSKVVNKNWEEYEKEVLNFFFLSDLESRLILNDININSVEEVIKRVKDNEKKQ